MAKSNIEGLRTSFTRDEYTSPEVFAKEMSDIYEQRWCYVGRADQLGHIGDRLVASIGNESIVAVRNRDGELRAYFNVCQHRGSQLCDSSGSGHGAGPVPWKTTRCETDAAQRPRGSSDCFR